MATGETGNRGSVAALSSARKKAALLSAFVFPGAGQFYNRQPIKAVVMLLLSLVFLGEFLAKLGSAYWQYMKLVTAIADPGSQITPPDWGSAIRGAILYGLVPVTVLWVFSVWDAHKNGHRRESPRGGA